MNNYFIYYQLICFVLVCDKFLSVIVYSRANLRFHGSHFLTCEYRVWKTLILYYDLSFVYTVQMYSSST